MTVDERDNVFMAIGSGDSFAAIRGLFKSVANKRIALRPDLVQECTTWLQTYVGHKDERYLRRLIEDYLVPYSRVPSTWPQLRAHRRNLRTRASVTMIT
jgi:hypothetical protein